MFVAVVGRLPFRVVKVGRNGAIFRACLEDHEVDWISGHCNGYFGLTH